MVWKKIKYVGKGVHARYYNEALNEQITVQDAYRGGKYEVLLFKLPNLKPKVDKKFDTKAKALKYASELRK
jgi:hypothetical protein